MGVGKEFGILFAVIFLPGFVSQGMGVDPAGWERIGYHLSLLTLAVPQILLVIYVTELRTPGVARRMGWRRPGWSDVLSGAIALVVLFLLLALMSLVVSLIGDSSFGAPVVEWQFTRLALLPLVVVSSLAIGYREEIFYRAYCIVRGEEVGLHPLAVIGASSLLFASGHVYQGTAGFVIALLVGIVFGATFHFRRSLHGIAAAHALYNTAVLIQSAVQAFG